MRSRHAKPRKPAGQGPNARVALFDGSPESDKRRRAVLDALDLVPLIDREGWIGFLAWAERVGYEVPHEKRDAERGAAIRKWERLKAALRFQGLEVEARPPEDYNSRNRAWTARPGEEVFAYERTAMRFTVDGWDRLHALTKALDDWLCAKREED